MSGFNSLLSPLPPIVYFVPKMEKPLHRLWENEADSPSQGSVSVLTRFRHTAVKWLVLSYLVTLAAQIGTTPLIAYHFFRAYPLGLIVGPVCCRDLSRLSLRSAWYRSVSVLSICRLRHSLHFFNHAIISVFLELIGIFGQTWGIVKLTPPTFGVFCLYIAFFLGIAQCRSVYRHRRIASLIGLAVLAIWVWEYCAPRKGQIAGSGHARRWTRRRGFRSLSRQSNAVG